MCLLVILFSSSVFVNRDLLGTLDWSSTEVISRVEEFFLGFIRFLKRMQCITFWKMMMIIHSLTHPTRSTLLSLCICRLQPVRDTREKQVELWKQLILKYCKHHKYFVVDLEEGDFPLFANANIDRK